jgi:hypothetical protein
MTLERAWVVRAPPPALSPGQTLVDRGRALRQGPALVEEIVEFEPIDSRVALIL